MKTLFLAAVASVLGLGPALAEGGCAVDYDSFAVRNIAPGDEALAKEQSAAAEAWFINSEAVTIRDRKYEKYGLPRVVPAAEVEFFAFKGSVPFLVEKAMKQAVPEILYAVTDPATCETQPYLVVP